jgi:hypothetical protein
MQAVGADDVALAVCVGEGEVAGCCFGGELAWRGDFADVAAVRKILRIKLIP